MAKQAIIKKVTLNLKYKNQISPFYFSHIKLAAQDQGIYDTAQAILALQDVSTNGIFKIVEREIAD